MKIAVAGGTGCVGKLVVDTVNAGGDTPIVLARSRGVDLTTGKGLDDALKGVTAVIDVSNITTLSRAKAVAFFEAATSHLLNAGDRAGVQHHVALSIVGCDRVDYGYYHGKCRQEQLVLAGPVPGSVLRATQFHEFAAQMLEHALGPLVLTPKMLNQTVAARDVAIALVDLARGKAVGMAPDLAGPEENRMHELVRRLISARRERRVLVPFRMPGAVGKAMVGGALLPTSPGPRGQITFDQWLATDAVAAGRPS